MVAASPAGTPALETRVRLREPLDLPATMWPVRRGTADPTTVIDGRTVWRATRTPEGPGTEALVAAPGHGEVQAWAWGPGGPWLLDHLPELLGAGDDPAALEALLRRRPATPPPGWDLVARLARRHRGLRIPRTRAVVEACVPSVLEQKVTGREARRSYRELVSALGEPAPGPRPGLRVPPAPGALAARPAWDLHRFGVERKRAETLRRVAAAAARLEAVTDLPAEDARAALTAVAGVGPWTAAEVGLVALGDADAVSVGDFHLCHAVAWSFLGRPRGDDELMLELLEPFRGHRGRVLRMLGPAPRFGPRQPVRSFREW